MDKNQTYYEESNVERFGRNLKNAIFKAYYNIISNQFQMQIIYLLLVLVEAIQILTIISFNISKNQDSTSYPTNFSQINDILPILQIILIFYPNKEFLTSSIIMYVVLFLLMIQYGFFIYYFNNDIDIKKPKKFFTVLLMRIFLILNILFQKLLTIPILVTCLSFFQCTKVAVSSTLINFPTTTCENEWYYVNVCISFFVLVMFLLLVFLNCMFLNDSRPISVLPWSGPKNHIQFCYVSLKVILSVFYVFNSSRPFYDIKIFVILVIIAVIIGCRVFNPLYHHNGPLSLEVIMEGTFLFVSILAIINYYINISYDIVTVISQIVIGFIFGYALLNIVNQVKDYYLNIDVMIMFNIKLLDKNN